MRHRYPFEALSWLRRQRVDREAAHVSDRAARSSGARTELARAELARQSSEQRIDELSRAEQAHLADGALRAGDLAQVDDWQKGAAAELRAKAEHEQRAQQALATEVAAEVVARRSLSAASNEAELIATHRIEWRAEREAAEERSEEEAAMEQWTAKRHPPRG